MERMTDERFAECEDEIYLGIVPKTPTTEIELLQALKAERKFINDDLHMLALRDGERIAQLEAERDDYKDRWEQTGCTRHAAMEAAIKVKDSALERIAQLEDQLDDLAGGVHSCHAKCQRPGCVQRRRIAELERDIGMYRELVNESEARCAELEAGYREAIEDIESWAAYADDYFQDKHDLAGTLSKHRAALGGDDAN